MVKPLKDLEARETVDFELLAQTSDCYPTTTAQWTKNGVNLTESTEHVTLSSEGNKHKLVVSNPVEADQGTYLVTVSNELGSVETSCNVTVLCKLLVSFRYNSQKKRNFHYFSYYFSSTCIC
jgi:hypothetical protein